MDSKRNCSACSRQFSKMRVKRKYTLNKQEQLIYLNQLNNKSLETGDQICNLCYSKSLKHLAKDDEMLITPSSSQNMISSQTSTTTAGSSQSSIIDPTFEYIVRSKIVETITLPVPSVASTHSYCTVCKIYDKPLVVIPKKARLHAYSKYNIYIPQNNRCCRNHLLNERLFDDCYAQLNIYSPASEIPVDEYKLLMDETKVGSFFQRFLHLDVSDRELKNFTSLSREDFIKLSELLNFDKSKKIKVYQALAVFLCKLKTNMSNELISTFFGMENHQLISRFSDKIQKCFENVLDQNIGPSSITREDIINMHTSDLAKRLFGVYDNCIFIVDGTYAYHQKSSNYAYQRLSYSMHKHTNLMKPFTFCTTNGFVIDMFGPYPAKMNDAEILEQLLETDHGLNALLKPGDVFVVDRGFRNVVPYLIKRSFVVKMPEFLEKNSKQLTAQQSNNSRIVTKVRWVVEAVHGVLKQKYKFLDSCIPNQTLPKVGTYFRIAALLNNMFGKKFDSDIANKDDILNQITISNKSDNSLMDRIETLGYFKKRSAFKKLDSSSVENFPQFTDEQLKILFTGTYQMKQAISYLAEHMMDQTFSIELCLQEDHLIKTRIQSRHQSSKSYINFIKYDPSISGIESITGYTCQCKNGLRTIGCCCHVAAVIYYLSNGRYQSEIFKPAEKLNQLFDHIPSIINDDSEED